MPREEHRNRKCERPREEPVKVRKDEAVRAAEEAIRRYRRLFEALAKL